VVVGPSLEVSDGCQPSLPAVGRRWNGLQKKILSFYYYQENTFITAKWMPGSILGGKKE
jgi:hypothetical protein